MFRDTNRIMIRANSKDWGDKPNPAVLLGKQQHIAWCVTELYRQHHMIIQAHEILLIDDDAENVQIAQEFGHQAYEVGEKVTMQDLKMFSEKLKVVKAKPVS